jgi:hypothetical protein
MITQIILLAIGTSFIIYFFVSKQYPIKIYEIEMIGRNALATSYKEVDRVNTRIAVRFNHMKKARNEKRKYQLNNPMIIYDLFKVVEI